MSEATNSDLGSVTATRRLSSSHPVFAGHFPTQPIVPGALLLDMLIRYAARQLSTSVAGIRIDQAKFLRPVGPGESIDLILHDAADPSSRRFSLCVGEHTVASGQITRVTPGEA